MAGTVYILDQTGWSEPVVRGLRDSGLIAHRMQDRPEFERFARRRPPDQIVIVESLPQANALQWFGWLRSLTDAPIGIVPDGDDERSLALFDAGADDVIPAADGAAVVVARIRALLRRHCGLPPRSGPRITIGDITVDSSSRSVLVGPRQVHLTPIEFSILHTLMRDPGVVYSREDLLDVVWGSRSLAVERTIDAHIWKLRRKIEPHAGPPCHIVSVPRLGYRFRRPDDLRAYEQPLAV